MFLNNPLSNPPGWREFIYVAEQAKCQVSGWLNKLESFKGSPRGARQWMGDSNPEISRVKEWRQNKSFKNFRYEIGNLMLAPKANESPQTEKEDFIIRGMSSLTGACFLKYKNQPSFAHLQYNKETFLIVNV